MDFMSAHMRANVFANGKYLYNGSFESPAGQELDPNLLNIVQAGKKSFGDFKLN